MHAGTVAGRSQKRAGENLDSLLTHLNGNTNEHGSKRVKFDMDNNTQGDDSGLEHSEGELATSWRPRSSGVRRSLFEPDVASSDYWSESEASDVSDISDGEVSGILHEAESLGSGTRSKSAGVLKAGHQTPASGPKSNVSLSQVPATNGAALASPIEISDDECENFSKPRGNRSRANAASLRDVSDKNGEYPAFPGLPHPERANRQVFSLPGLGIASAIEISDDECDVVSETGTKQPLATNSLRFVADPSKAFKKKKGSPDKYFCVRVGRVPGIYAGWREAKAQVKYVNEAVFKTCYSADEANDFMNHRPEDCTYPLLCGQVCKVASSVPGGTIELSDEESGLVPKPGHMQAIATTELRFVADPSKAGKSKKGKKKGKYYCVRIGRVPGIYSGWQEAKEQGQYGKGAIFRTCYGVDEANDFMNQRPENCKYPDNCNRRGRQCEEAHSVLDETTAVTQGTGGQSSQNAYPIQAETVATGQETRGEQQGSNRYFCVRHGWKPGIYHDGPSAFAQVQGLGGAVYKLCKSAKEADDFMNHRPEDCKYPLICGRVCREVFGVPHRPAAGAPQNGSDQNAARVTAARSRRQGQPQQTRSHRHCVCCDEHIGIGVLCEACRLSYSHRKEGVIKKHGLRSDQVIQLNKIFAGNDVRFPDTDAFEREGVAHAIRDFWAAYNVPVVVISSTDTAPTLIACVRRGDELPTHVMWRVDEGIPAVIRELFGVVQPGCGKEVVELSDDED